MTRQAFAPIQEHSVLQPRDQNIFREEDTSSFLKKQKESSCFEPLPFLIEDDTPMKFSRSSLSWDHPLEHRRSFMSPSPFCDQSWWDEDNDPCQDGFLDLPEDFIPPRHDFGRNKKKCEYPSRSRPTTVTYIHETMPDLDEGFVYLRDSDVVCGRGAPTMHHPGNQTYRALVKTHETDYLCAKRSDKPIIATKIMETLKQKEVRFVRRERGPSGYGWVLVEENKIYEKICQSLREGAPELRRKMLASNVRKSMIQPPSWVEESDQENNAPIQCH